MMINYSRKKIFDNNEKKKAWTDCIASLCNIIAARMLLYSSSFCFFLSEYFVLLAILAALRIRILQK